MESADEIKTLEDDGISWRSRILYPTFLGGNFIQFYFILLFSFAVDFCIIYTAANNSTFRLLLIYLSIPIFCYYIRSSVFFLSETRLQIIVNLNLHFCFLISSF